MINLVSTYGVGFDHDISRLPTFTGRELFHIFDVFDQKYLESVVAAKDRPGTILSDHIILLHEDHGLGLTFFGLPLWVMRECRQWSHADFDPNQDLLSTQTFNFMINKTQCNRYILIKLVEMYGYQNFQYTWSGLGRSFDMHHVISEMDQLGPKHPAGSSDFRTRILSPIDLPVKFFHKKNILMNHADRQERVSPYGRIELNSSTKFTWDNFLNDIFRQSCVSLISETGGVEKQAVFTEKTLYAVFGLTFPIWIGNYGQAQAIEQIGLDVFNDVIDHSYQWHPTLIERCYWAFELNKKLLGNLAFSHDLRQLHRDRLLANRKFLLNDGLGNFCQNQIGDMPRHLQDAVRSVKKIFDSTPSNSGLLPLSSRFKIGSDKRTHNF